MEDRILGSIEDSILLSASPPLLVQNSCKIEVPPPLLLPLIAGLLWLIDLPDCILDYD